MARLHHLRPQLAVVLLVLDGRELDAQRDTQMVEGARQVATVEGEPFVIGASTRGVYCR